MPFRVIRPSDLLVLTLDFHNVTLVPPAADRPARLVPEPKPGDDAFVVVELPPQAIGENTLVPGTPLLAGLVAARYSGITRLAFRFPPNGLPMDFRIEDILARLESLPMELAKTTFGKADPRLSHVTTTAIEVPWGLVLSPRQKARWRHRSIPVLAAETHRAELWHTRLAEDLHVRAIANPRDDKKARIQPPLESDERDLLVQHAANNDPDAEAALLALSALGAWLDVRGEWNVKGNDLLAWRHRSTMGRDQFVQTVTAGFLFPFGHKAIAVKTTQRSFQKDERGNRTAFLVEELRLFVREPVREYVTNPPQPPGEHRGLPFTSVRLKTLASPPLISAADNKRFEPVLPGKGASAFWPKTLDGNNFPFVVVATDRQGAQVDLRMPLAFVAATTAATDQAVRNWMTAEPNPSYAADSRSRCSLGNQRVAYAEPAPSQTLRADTVFETEQIEFGGAFATQGACPFRAVLRTARAVIPPVREVTGSAAPVAFTYHSDYLGGDGNPLDVFAKLVTPIDLALGSAQAGGIASVGFPIERLSRVLGPVGPAAVEGEGAAKKVIEGKVTPKTYFAGALPKLLGQFDLVELLPDSLEFPNVGSVFGSGPDLPRVVTTRDGDAVHTRIQWETKLDKLTPGARLSLDVDRVTDPNGASHKATGIVSDFALQIPADSPLIKLPMRTLKFVTELGRKPDLALKVDPPEFDGPLRFVNALTRVLDPDGFSDPPNLSVTDEGITVGYTLAVPNVTVAVFSLQNLALSAAFAIPLVGDPTPTLRFDFSERHNPFIVTYSVFGGGGHVGLVLGLQGIVVIEGSLEFGGAFALDVGVASGGVALMAGVAFTMAKNPSGSLSTTLGGYIRCVGALDVLGLIEITAQFHLQLDYEITGRKLTGTATLTVEVEVLFFSESVELTVHRELAKGDDPTMGQVLPDPQMWAAYCRAFEGVS